MDRKRKATRTSSTHENWLIKQIENGIENSHSAPTRSSESAFSRLQNKVDQQNSANARKQKSKIPSDATLLKSLRGIHSGSGLTQGRNHNDVLYNYSRIQNITPSSPQQTNSGTPESPPPP